MKKHLTILILVTFLSSEGFSQFWGLRRLEITAGAGITHFFGDIGGFTEGTNYSGFRDLSVYNTGLNAGASVRYLFSRNFSGRVNTAFGNFHVNDKRGSNRPREFESTITFFESSLLAEYYFIKNKRDDSYLFIRGLKDTRHPGPSFYDFYLFGGIGGLAHNSIPNPVLAARNAGSKGFKAVVPFGIGISRNYSRNSKIGIELGRRQMFSDDTDGYSMKGSRLDVYYFLNLNYTWKVKTTNSPTF